MTQNRRSNSEVGHIKNLENYNDFIIYSQSLEPRYNPTRQQITIVGMQTHHNKATGANEKLRLARYELAVVINTRQDKFKAYKKKATRMHNALIAATSDQLIIDDFVTVNKKIQGRLSMPKTIENQTNQEIMRAISNSQQSIDQIIDHFADAVQVLELVPDYNPNEADLKIPELKVYITELKEANIAVVHKFITYSKALDIRDELFYHPETGIVKTAKIAKAYIKSVYGTTSPEYKFANAIQFRTIIRRKKKKKKKEDQIQNP